MNRINLNEDLNLSRFVHGYWRLTEWGLSDQELLRLGEEACELGVTTIDHADIYGNYTCEEIFGRALRLKPSFRQNIEIVTKCGIKLMSDKFPERKIKHYDYSEEYIIWSAENSLKLMGLDYIDVLLLHRPAPFFDPEEVASAFSKLKKDGKVLHFGVSNFTPLQFEMLNTFCDEKLVTNQVEISPWCLENFENGNMDFFLKEKVHPMAWSPLAGGSILSPSDEKGERLLRAINEVGEELNLDSADKVIYAWLLKHPASILPVLGTSKIERIKNALESTRINMSLEQWYKIYTASTGKNVP